MMRHLKILGFLAAAGVVLPSVPAFAEGAVVLRGARVLTMDDKVPEAAAIAIVDGRIAAVGSVEDVAPFLPGAAVYDLPADALVMPGFQDAHNHLIWSATEAEDVSLAEVTSTEGVREAFSVVDEAALKPGSWIRGSGWDIAAFPSAHARILDEVVPDYPVFVASVDAHSAWVNTAALKAAGIGAATPDPEGGRIERDETGNPTGILRENAMELVSKLLPDYPEAQVETGLEKAQAEALSYGITAIIDPSADEWMLRGYQRADEAGKLRLRVQAAVKVAAKEGAEGIKRVLAWQEKYRSPNLAVTSAKLFVDGVLETGTAALLEAYVGSNQAGDLLFTPEQLAEIATAADAAKLQLHAHAIGDRGVRATLDAYEAAQKANGPRDARHQITHLELIDQADIPRFKALGALANIQALWAYPDSYITDLTEPKIGPERSEWLYPFGALKAAGATLVGSSDWSVSSMNPLEAIQTGVTRQDITDPEGRVLTPQHRLELMDMLRAYTVNAAYSRFDEAESGTLTVGKRADIVVLDRDLTKVAVTEIAHGKVLATLVNGKLEFEGEGLPQPSGP